MDIDFKFFINSIKEIPSQIVPSAKLIFSSVGTIIKFFIGFVISSIVLYIGLLIGLLKNAIPDFFSIADELNGGTGILHFITTIIGWVVMSIPFAIAAMIAFFIMSRIGATEKIRRAACILFATIISAYLIIPMLLGGGSKDFGLSDAIIIVIVLWGAYIVSNIPVDNETPQ